MANKFYKNFILCGDIEFCCVLCKEAFDSLESADRHIRWEKHRKIFRTQVKMSKFKKDSIYKIDDIYYCEDCNRVLTSIAEIKQHIDDVNHIEKKANPVTELPKSICYRAPGNSGLIVIGNLKVTSREWNGIVENKCVLCDLTIDNFAKHISLSRHVINLIDSEICTAEGQQHYRKINLDICYCFMCKSTFPTSSVNDHWVDQQHLDKIRATIESLEEKIKNDRAHFEKKLAVAIQLINSQKQFFNIDVENKVAICKICTSCLSINFLQMTQHRKSHNVTEKDDIAAIARAHMREAEERLKKAKKIRRREQRFEARDHGKIRSELAKFGRENGIKLVPPGGRGYCSLCNIFISAHKKNFTEHINGHLHTGHLALQDRTEPLDPEYNTRRLKNYLETVVFAEPFKVMWINQHFALYIYSFLLIATIDKKAKEKKIKCYACDIIFDHGKAREHCLTEKHKEGFINCRVITSIDNEFIREIRPSLYHCGLCNRTLPFSQPLEKHLYSWKHLFTKTDRETRENNCKTFYEDIVPPNFNYERVYNYLMSIII